MYKIIVVEDQTIMRKAIVDIISNVDNIKVVGEASNGIELFQIIDKALPDCIIMDVVMPKMDGIEATKEIRRRNLNIKIIAFSGYCDEGIFDKMILAGASGFILKIISEEELKEAIKLIASGNVYFSDELLPSFLNKTRNIKKIEKESILSNREIEVLKLISEGLTNKDIAEALYISVHTVANHRASLILKTNSKNSLSLLSYAYKHKIIDS